MNATSQAFELSDRENALMMQDLAQADSQAAMNDSQPIEDQIYWQEWAAHSNQCMMRARDMWITWNN